MGFDGSSPVSTLLLVAAAAAVPFVLMVLTSYAKIYIVLSFTRLAISTPQAPPNLVLAALATLLSVFAMAPVAQQAWDRVQPLLEEPAPDAPAADGTANDAAATERDLARLAAIARAVSEPLAGFLERNSAPDARRLFDGLAVRRGIPASSGPARLLVLAPAFVITELQEAFLAAFLLFLPFLVVDLVVSNALLALGMHMLSPTTISLPFKILLFVAVDGWELLSRGLVLAYR